MAPKTKRALLLIDIQKDFMPGGALAVAGGDEIIPVADRLRRSKRYDLVVATQDHHPANHGSFASNHKGKKPYEVIDLNGLQQVLWPDHCVQDTPGVQIDTRLGFSRIDAIFRKGENPEVDSYSGFFDNGKRGDTGLHAFLQKAGIAEVDVVGLATDYCVRFTVLDALELGYGVRVIKEGVRAVNVKPTDGDEALAQMAAKGAKVVSEAEAFEK